MDSSRLVSLIPRISNENSARRTLSSSKCLARPLMFKQPILKPWLARKKLGIVERRKLPERTLVAIWCGRTDRGAGGRTYGHVTTKISRIER